MLCIPDHRLSWRYSVVAITTDSDLYLAGSSVNPGSNPGSAFFWISRDVAILGSG